MKSNIFMSGYFLWVPEESGTWISCKVDLKFNNREVRPNHKTVTSMHISFLNPQLTEDNMEEYTFQQTPAH